MATPDLVNPPSGPLKGIRVLDFGTFVAGTYNAVLMGDLGADVIKVEPLTGDPARQLGLMVAGESRVFVGWNRNKRGLALNLRAPGAQQIIHDLIPGTDVVTGNFRPEIVTKLGLDYETLSAINPGLIYCASSGFGTKGPLSQRPAFDAVLQTMGGVAQANAALAGKVTLAAPVMVDMHTAMLGLSAILAALYHRERTGEGQKVETSLLQGVMSMGAAAFCRPLEAEEEGGGGGAPYGLYDTKEGIIFVAALIDKHWRILCESLGDPALASDPRFLTNPDRITNRPEMQEKLEPKFLEKTAAEWEEILAEHGVPCAVACSSDEFFDHPQVEAMGMNPVIQHSSIGPIRVYGVPFDFEKTPGGIQRSSPRLGEHNEEILGELGYSTDRIAALRRDGVIASPDR